MADRTKSSVFISSLRGANRADVPTYTADRANSLTSLLRAIRDSITALGLTRQELLIDSQTEARMPACYPGQLQCNHHAHDFRCSDDSMSGGTTIPTTYVAQLVYSLCREPPPSTFAEVSGKTELKYAFVKNNPNPTYPKKVRKLKLRSREG